MIMNNNSSTTPTCYNEGSPLRQSCNDDLETGNIEDNETTKNGYFRRLYQTALIPDVRISLTDERPSKSKLHVRDVSPIQVSTRSTCFRILVPETTAEKLGLFVCLTIFCTLLVTVVYFFVKIECIFGIKEQKCKS